MHLFPISVLMLLPSKLPDSRWSIATTSVSWTIFSASPGSSLHWALFQPGSFCYGQSRPIDCYVRLERSCFSVLDCSFCVTCCCSASIVAFYHNCYAKSAWNSLRAIHEEIKMCASKFARCESISSRRLSPPCYYQPLFRASKALGVVRHRDVFRSVVLVNCLELRYSDGRLLSLEYRDDVKHTNGEPMTFRILSDNQGKPFTLVLASCANVQCCLQTACDPSNRLGVSTSYYCLVDERM